MNILKWSSLSSPHKYRRRILNGGCLIYSVNEVQKCAAGSAVPLLQIEERRYIGRNFGSNRRNRAGRFNGKPAAGLALSEGDHAKFSRVSMSNGTKRRSGYHEVLPRDSTVKRWTPLPSAFLAPPAFPADFGDFVYPYLLYFIPLMILGIYSPIYQSSEDSTCSNSFFIVFLAKPMTLSLRL